jgi:hypothetical protein
MKLKFITDTDKGIEYEGGYFTGHIERDGEAVFSFNIGPSSVDYKHYYNGYANYMTWAVSLWLDNDEGLYKHVRNVAERIQKQHGNESAYQLEKWLKEYVANANPLGGAASMFSDIMNHALAWVDFREIAENILSE